LANELSIQIKNDLSELGKVVQFLQEFCMEKKIPNMIANSIDLVLDEILNNIISYGYVDQKEHEIDIQLSIVERQLVLKIEDDGREFNPLEITEVDRTSSMEDREIGGLGIHLIRNAMDEVRHIYKNKKNYLVMKKNIEE
jgi:anti-sigma regulatory factor (Ser/Thr protein kinase)